MITEFRRKASLLTPRENPCEIEEPHGTQIVPLAVSDILPNRNQPRSSFNQTAISRLSDSIRRYGILQPLTVRKVLLPTSAGAHTTVYELIAGERRLRAAKLAGLGTVPCVIINTDDATSAELAIVENLLRENLNMFEQAEAFQRLIVDFRLTQDEAARRVSMSQSAVANKLRLLRFPPEERAAILENGLTERHARALLKIADAPLRASVLQHIVTKKMNVSATESYIDHILYEISRFQSASPSHGTSPEREPAAVSDTAVTSPAQKKGTRDDCGSAGAGEQSGAVLHNEEALDACEAETGPRATLCTCPSGLSFTAPKEATISLLPPSGTTFSEGDRPTIESTVASEAGAGNVSVGPNADFSTVCCENSPKTPCFSAETKHFCESPQRECVAETVSDTYVTPGHSEAPTDCEEDAIADFPEPIQEVINLRRGRFKGCIRDMQLFYNSLRNAIRLLDRVGVAGNMSKSEFEDHIVVTISLRRQTASEKPI